MRAIHESRVLFLKEFTKHLIINSKPFKPEKLEKADLLLIPPIKEAEEIPKTEERKKEKKKLTREIATGIKGMKPSIMPPAPSVPSAPLTSPIVKPITKPTEQAPRPTNIPKQAYLKSPLPQARPRIKPAAPLGFIPSMISKPTTQPPTAPPPIPQPTPTALPPDFSLGKIDILIQDPRVTVIECPGPGKFILAKR
jgi:hypothetical protein